MSERLVPVLALAAVFASAAEAKPARCYTSDDGRYACDFQQFGGDGSFTISAPARPTYTISIIGRGVADGFANFGNRSIPLPGPFYRSRSDRACWVSAETDFAVCAY